MKFDSQSLTANQRLAQYRTRLADGLPANPDTPLVLHWLRQNQEKLQALLPATFTFDDSIYFDLTTPDTRGPDQVEKFVADIHQRLQENQASIAIGRYAENRHCYQSDIFQTTTESRTFHIGVDIFVPEGTLLHAPLDATVHSFQNNDNLLDYGPTIVLQHRVKDCFFYSLYGHLAAQSLEGLQAGMEISGGEVFAQVGNSTENGGWPPHVHVQLISDMLEWRGDYPGVVTAADKDLWLSLCPDPKWLLRLPEPTPENTVALTGR